MSRTVKAFCAVGLLLFGYGVGWYFNRKTEVAKKPPVVDSAQNAEQAKRSSAAPAKDSPPPTTTPSKPEAEPAKHQPVRKIQKTAVKVLPRLQPPPAAPVLDENRLADKLADRLVEKAKASVSSMPASVPSATQTLSVSSEITQEMADRLGRVEKAVAEDRGHIHTLTSTVNQINNKLSDLGQREAEDRQAISLIAPPVITHVVSGKGGQDSQACQLALSLAQLNFKMKGLLPKGCKWE